MDHPGRTNKRRRAVAALGLIASLSALTLWVGRDPAADSWRTSRQLEVVVASDAETTTGVDRLCIATVDDGTVSTAAVVDADTGRYLNLALPKMHETHATIECTATDADGRVTVESTSKEHLRLDQRGRLMGHTKEKGRRLLGQYQATCDPKSYQPGYYNETSGAWIDRCTGRTTQLANIPSQVDMKRQPRLWTDLSPDKCPIPSSRPGADDVWVSLVGDSVMRQMYQRGGLLLAGIPNLNRATSWSNGRQAGKARGGDFMLYGHHHRASGRTIWFSFSWTFVPHPADQEMWPVPYGWGDFMDMRGEGPREDDPPFGRERLPDVVFFGPGYHASVLDAGPYGETVDEILARWQAAAEALVPLGPVPHVHVLLNMLPAPWMLPEKYAFDVKFRTLAREHQKNLAILDAAKKYDVVSSVVDAFSVELPFNGVPGDTVHGDAVHVRDDRILKLVGEKMVDRICHWE